MKKFAKIETPKTASKKGRATANTHDLSLSDLAQVCGGINPQPLPPCRAARQ